MDRFKRKHNSYNPVAKKGIKKAIANLCNISPRTVIATDPGLVPTGTSQPSLPASELSEDLTTKDLDKRVSWSDKIPTKEVLKHKLLQKSPNLQTELTLEDVMSSSFMQDHLLNLEIESIDPEVFNLDNQNIDSYLTFENDKLAALHSRQKLFSSDRGTVVYDPERKQNIPNTQSFYHSETDASQNKTTTARNLETKHKTTLRQTGDIKIYLEQIKIFELHT